MSFEPLNEREFIEAQLAEKEQELKSQGKWVNLAPDPALENRDPYLFRKSAFQIRMPDPKTRRFQPKELTHRIPRDDLRPLFDPSSPLGAPPETLDRGLSPPSQSPAPMEEGKPRAKTVTISLEDLTDILVNAYTKTLSASTQRVYRAFGLPKSFEKLLQNTAEELELWE